MFSRSKINVFDFTDYRKFLQAFYVMEKALDPTFSYRVFACAVEMDASLLLKVIQEKRHISPKSVEAFVAFFRFKEAKGEYFREMVNGAPKISSCRSSSTRCSTVISRRGTTR